jgi:undecaprenyl-diphosphatase
VEEFNRHLFLMLNAGPSPSFSSLALATVLAQWVIYGIPILLVSMWLWGGQTARAAVLTSSSALLMALCCNVFIGELWFHPRPFMVPLGYQYLEHAAETSFPSDHAVVFFAVGLGMAACRMWRIGSLLVALGMAVGAARVYLGVHFPFDIMGALCVSVACNCLVVALLDGGTNRRHCLDIIEAMYRRVFACPINLGWVLP